MQEINELLVKSEDEVLDSFGKVLSDGTVGATSEGPSQRIKRAREWLARNKGLVASLVCNDQVVTFCRKFPERKFTLANALAEVLIGTYGALFASHVAVLLILEGIDTLCTPDKLA